MPADQAEPVRSGAAVSPRQNDPVRVAIDHRIFVYQKHGGVSRYFCGIADKLDQFGVAPRIIAPLYATDRLRELPSGLVWGRHFAHSRAAQKAAQLVGEVSQRPLAALYGARVVHESYFGARRLAPASARIVLTVYDMIYELFPDMFPAGAEARSKAVALKRADQIICISENTRKDLVAFFPEVEARTTVIPLGFDPDFGTGGETGAPHSRPYILFVGMRQAYKNFAGLVSAYAQSRLPNEGIEILCVGGGAFTDEERRSLSELGIADKVRQRGASDAELRTLYRHALLFAYPSLYEGFGIPPLEAMAADCPVVCINISSVPEVCGDAAEYAQPDSLESLRSALENVALNSSRADQLRAAGRERVTRFSWQECARQTAAIYKALA